MLALYMYASGASRQNITVASHCGLSASYTTIAGSQKAAKALFKGSQSVDLSHGPDAESPNGRDDDSESDSESEDDEIEHSEVSHKKIYDT